MAAGSASVDAVLADAVSKLDALKSRMDAMELGEKNIIKGDKRRSDDDDDKKDDMTAPKHVIKDSKKSDDDDDDDKGKKDSAKAKSDDDDDDRKKDSTKKSDDDDDDKGKKDSTKAKSDDDDDDKGKKDSSKKSDAFPPRKGKKDDDGELEIKHGKERDDSKKRGDDDDDDDKGKKDDAAKADSITELRRQISDQSAMIRRLESLMKPRSDDEHTAFAEAQAKADSVFIGLGQRAPRPLEGEALSDYRKRLASKLKSYSNSWKAVKLTKLPDEAFDIAETQIYADAVAAASNPTDLAAGELRMVSRQDPETGLRTNYFYGPESFVKRMGRPGRKVTSFRTNFS